MRILALSGRCSPPLLQGRAGRTACLASLVASLFFFLGCSNKKGQTQGGMREAVPVTVATVIQKTVPVEVQAIGNVEAYSTVSIKSQAEGQVERIYFKEGRDVKKGDLLVTIDPRPFDAELKQAEANLARDLAQAKHAKAEAERSTKLYQEGIVSKEQYDQFQTNAEALDAALRADNAAIENAKVRLGYCTIRSPLDGRTGSILVHEGNVVKANDISLVVINQVNPILVNFSVPEQNLLEVKKYMAIRPLKVEALIPNGPRPAAEGVLSFVDNAVDSSTGTIRLKATFANRERRLWPGQFVNVTLKLTEQPNAVVVPSQAVQTGQAGQYVFVVKPDLTAESRPVGVGRTRHGETVIEKGLMPGEKVVTDGQLRLIPGAKVEVKTSPRGS